MKNLPFPEVLKPLWGAFHFYRRHWPVVLGLALIAGTGRVMQLGGFGPISRPVHIALEVVIGLARLMLLFFALGMANAREGIRRIRTLFINSTKRRVGWRTFAANFKKNRLALLVSFGSFLLVAIACNYLINLLAYETCLLMKLKQDGLLADGSSPWVILLFFKNLTIIPFTLIFESMIVLWLGNKLSSPHHRAL